MRALLLPVLLAVGTAALVLRVPLGDPTATLVCNYVHPDCLGNHWLLVWVAEQLSQGAPILHNTAYYWPTGDYPWLAGNGSEGFLYLPFHLTLGWPLGANVYLGLILTLNGLAAYALARACGVSEAVGLTTIPVAGLFAYTTQELGAGRFSQVSWCWLGFFLASTLRFLRDGRSPAAPAVLLSVTCLFYWYYGLFGVLAGAVLFAFHPVSWRRILPFIGIGAALILPLLWVFLRDWGAVVGSGETAFPHPQAKLDATFPTVPFLAQGGRHSGRALPLLTCVLALMGLGRTRLSLAWVSITIIFATLMAGPLIPNGPYEWIYGIAAPLRRFWWPYRHVLMMNVALVMLAAVGTERLLAKFGARTRWVVCMTLVLSVPIQLRLQGVPIDTQWSKVVYPEPFYAEVRDLPGFLLLEPPLAPQLASSQTPLAYQLTHHKQLINGHAMWVERVRPPAWDNFVSENSFLSSMQALERGELGNTFSFEPAHLQALIDAGLGTIVLNREYFPSSHGAVIVTYAEVFTALFGPPTVVHKRARAWGTASWAGLGEVRITPFVWPKHVEPGGPDLAIMGRHDPSLGFSIPEMAPR